MLLINFVTSIVVHLRMWLEGLIAPFQIVPAIFWRRAAKAEGQGHSRAAGSARAAQQNSLRGDIR